MVVSKGSQVIIAYGHDREGNTTDSITASLAEDVSFSMSSAFSQFLDDTGNKAIDVLGSAMKSFGMGFSSQIKQAGFQLWNKTEPIGLSLSLEFFRTTNAANDISFKVHTLAGLCLPGLMNNRTVLVPPGPSIIEALGADVTGTDSYINVTIGGLMLKKCIMTKAEPTYSKYQDSSGYPISARMAVSIITMFSGTKDDLIYL